MLMPKPWVGGWWVRVDPGSQGRKAAQARDPLMQPRYLEDREEGGSDPSQDAMSLARVGGPRSLHCYWA